MKKSILLLVFLILFVGNSGVEGAGWQGTDIYSETAIQYSTAEQFEAKTGKTIDQYNEAPEFAEMVKQGELPPIEQRLPDNPVVIEPAENIGLYGGTLKRVWKGPSDRWGVRKLFGERFVTGAPDRRVHPNVAERWEIVDQGKTYIFHLRKGLKWSDGHPVTADDAMFWWEVRNDKELDGIFGPPKSDFYINDQLCEWKKIDDYTFSVSFVAPHATFLEFIASEGKARMIMPKHYMEKFYPRYTPLKEVNKIVQKEGHDDWKKLMEAKWSWPDMNPNRPTITAWIPANEPSESFFIMKRNPYYWKIDSAGNQLPYIEKIAHEQVTDKEIMTMRVISGEVDFQNRHMSFDNYPLYMENRERGNYRVMNIPDIKLGESKTVIFINLNIQDQVKAEIFNNDQFRKALSLGINREVIIGMFFFGQAIPFQAAFPAETPFYDQEWAQAYIDYDPERANQMLDQIGLKWGDNKYRQYPDGSTLTVSIELTDGKDVNIYELVKDNWKDIGVNLQINTPERSLREERTEHGNFELAAWSFDTSDRPDLLGKHWSVSKNESGVHWGPLYNKWYRTGGKDGVEPPAEIARLNQIYMQLKSTPDFDQRKELMQEVIDFHKEHIFMIGMAGIPSDSTNSPGSIVIVDERLRNVKPWPIVGVLSRGAGISMIQQFYFEP